MDIKQHQHLLCALGYEITCDGLSGPATVAAVKQFQADYRLRPDGSNLRVDGLWGPATEKAIREVIGNGEKSQQPASAGSGGYKWINPEDFRCRCGGKYCDGWPAKPHKKTMDLLERVGEHFQTRPVVHSGLRCETWNRIQGGATYSKHRFGAAVDFHVPGHTHEEVRDFCETLLPGTGGIGIYRWGIHMDDRPVKGRWDNR